MTVAQPPENTGGLSCRITLEPDYIWAQVFRRPSQAAFREFYARIVSLGNSSGQQRILMDSHETEVPSVLWIYEAAKDIPRTPYRRLAALYRCREVYVAIAKFVETVTEHRGYSLACFHDFDAARAWLALTDDLVGPRA